MSVNAEDLEYKILQHKNDTHSNYRPWIWPRNPLVYLKTGHYINQVENDMRHFTEDQADKCIREGTIYPASGDKIIFRIQEHGVSFYTVCGYDQNAKEHYRITVYPFLYDLNEALTEESPYSRDVVKDYEGITTEYLLRDYVQEMMAERYGITYSYHTLTFRPDPAEDLRASQTEQKEQRKT